MEQQWSLAESMSSRTAYEKKEARTTKWHTSNSLRTDFKYLNFVSLFDEFTVTMSRKCI